jgi:hypothetical protein
MNDPLETLCELRDYLDDRADMIDGPPGHEADQRPNDAMRLLVQLDEVIAKLKAPRGWK